MAHLCHKFHMICLSVSINWVPKCAFSFLMQFSLQLGTSLLWAEYCSLTPQQEQVLFCWESDFYLFGKLMCRITTSIESIYCSMNCMLQSSSVYKMFIDLKLSELHFQCKMCKFQFAHLVNHTLIAFHEHSTIQPYGFLFASSFTSKTCSLKY